LDLPFDDDDDDDGDEVDNDFRQRFAISINCVTFSSNNNEELLHRFNEYDCVATTSTN
jgi:hypothetical protein